MNESIIANLLIGESAPIRRIRADILKLAPARLSVLIEGPTGAGKELVARALHVASQRHGTFVAFNVCAISDGMFESALFGHTRGAFTGALTSSDGLLVEADKGTVFFDEIGGLPLHAQIKLLRAIELHEFRPVGGKTDRRSDFRVVAASNENVTTLVRMGRFRADLAHRMAGAIITVPPLATHVEDIPLLVRCFVNDAVSQWSEGVEFSNAALRLLQDQEWPGNIRELRNVVERVIAFTTAPRISRADVLAVLDKREVHFKMNGSAFEERWQLVELLDSVSWDIEQVAERLGKHRTTVYRKMKRLGIARADRPMQPPLETRV